MVQRIELVLVLCLSCMLPWGLMAADGLYGGPHGTPTLVPSAYDGVAWRECLDRPFALIRSSTHPAWMLRAESTVLRCFSKPDKYDWSPPTALLVPTRDGIRSLRRGGEMDGAVMSRPWLLASFAGSESFDVFDAPYLVVLQHRAEAIRLDADGVTLTFSEEETGWVGAMPLFGMLKLPLRDSLIRELPCVQRSLASWTWSESLPDDVIRRCDWWSRTIRAFPVRMMESFSVDDTARTLTIRQEYEYFNTTDDWGTEPLKFAAVAPTLGLALDHGTFPVTFSAPLHDPGLMTHFGPLVGALGVDRLDAVYSLMSYIHETERMQVPPPESAVGQEALGILRKAMAKRFPDGDSWRVDFGKWSFCWAIQSDYWYPYGLPYLEDPEAIEKARGSLRKYYDEYVLQRERFGPHRGKLQLHGPGIASWGRWGDSGKFSANLLRSVWAYAHFTDDWDLIRERWALLKRLFITPEEMDWTGVGRHSIAEQGDEAPPCIAMARMAYRVGDMDTYHFASYCAVREFVHHYVKSYGSSYFYRHQPVNRAEPMPMKVFPTNIWGTTAGWQIDGPHYPRKHGERQYTNRWVRFHCLDTARFFRDYLSKPVAWELTDPELGWDHWAWRYNRDDSHIMTSYIRARSFLMEDSPEKLASLVPPSCMREYEPTGTIAPMIAFIRTARARETDRLIPAAEHPSPYAAGLERSAERENTYSIAQDYYGSYPPAPLWWKWGRGRKQHRVFGGFDPFPGMVRGHAGRQRLSYVSELFWFDPVVPREAGAVTPTTTEWETQAWSVCGPFSNPEDDGLKQRVYEPEQGVELDKSYTHDGLTASWHRLVPIDNGKNRGRLDMEGTLLNKKTPKGGKLAYVSGFVKSDRVQRAVLRLGAAGGMRVWVNGEEVHYWHVGSKWEEGRVTIALRKGSNEILIKVGKGWGKWQVYASVVGADDLPLPGLEFSALSPGGK
ncbi:MAG: hypothetical protein HN742_01230 [Lentisphaerae bacterium]|jgi:hypothetical protein|nr:hypothetical protein [Lentisphaerota bacterium]MBT4815632.1 hypothetical protein [Lentisphaerota bacterium]MBT5612520.1 hypothetical protein [Lentisphaerota bacterium]MBT7061315.1 hypothetical protein [Lentisphaerota bacterium]MBT7840456.1 hypothetical protein [Lentisphaerota bacterium]